MAIEKILITDDAHPSLEEGLIKLGYQVHNRPNISLDQTREIVGSYSGIVINSKIKVDVTFLKIASSLKFIARLGSGLDIIDLPAAKKQGVSVINSPEGNKNAVAEHALGMLLTLANKYLTGDVEVRNFNWQREKNRGFELEGKSIGIVGFGNTGSQFAKKLSSFDVSILAYDKYKKGFGEEIAYVQEVSLDSILTCDIISFHLPLTSETHYFCNKEFIDSCKENVIIINTSRGKVVSVVDLVLSLESGKVGGVCLDVFENENPASYTITEKQLYKRLFNTKNTVFTPHVAGWTHQSKEKIASVLLDKISSLKL